MIRHTNLFSYLAVSLAVFSLSMAPRPASVPSQPLAVVHAAPIHSLTGVAFHAVSVGY